jgi:thiamine phosphate synthase YjbQ (UPF0047 family)
MVFRTSLMLCSEESTAISDITKPVRNTIQQFPVKAGNVLIKTLHTTCALFSNEFQGSLIGNLKALIERLAPERNEYRPYRPALVQLRARQRALAPARGAPGTLGRGGHQRG